MTFSPQNLPLSCETDISPLVIKWAFCSNECNVCETTNLSCPILQGLILLCFCSASAKYKYADPSHLQCSEDNAVLVGI